MGTPSSEDIGTVKKKKNVLVTRLSGKSDKFVFSDRLIQTAALKKEGGGKNWEINILVKEVVEIIHFESNGINKLNKWIIIFEATES